MNPRQMKKAMKKMGITTEEIDGVEEVIIRTDSKEYVISGADVTMMDIQGQKTYQVVGETEIRDRAEDRGRGPSVPEEDIQLVVEQTDCSREQAIEALEECDGQLAEAILKLMSS